MLYYLIRHGQTDWNVERRLQGQCDIPMNPEGIRQMTALAEKLAARHVHIDSVISSPLNRAYTSARILAERIGYKGEISLDADFIERSFGLLEGTVWNSPLNLEDPVHHVEPLPDLCIRAKHALSKYAFPADAEVMIVSHGAFLSALVHVLSDGTIPYADRNHPIIQGNALCCEIRPHRPTIFYNLF